MTIPWENQDDMHLVATLAILQQAYAPAVLQADAPGRDQHTLRCTLRHHPRHTYKEIKKGAEKCHLDTGKPRVCTQACLQEAWGGGGVGGGGGGERENKLSSSEDLNRVNLTRILYESIHDCP